MTNDELRVRVRELIAAGDLPEEPPVVVNSRRWLLQIQAWCAVSDLWRAGCSGRVLLAGRPRCAPSCGVRRGVEAGARSTLRTASRLSCSSIGAGDLASSTR